MVYNRFNMKEKNKRAWVVAADMGYGHQRTAYPLRDIAFGEKVINANSYHGIPKKDRNIWEQTRSLYEVVSRLKRVAAQIYHPDSGINPDSKILQAINSFLNDQEPKKG